MSYFKKVVTLIALGLSLTACNNGFELNENSMLNSLFGMKVSIQLPANNGFTEGSSLVLVAAVSGNSSNLQYKWEKAAALNSSYLMLQNNTTSLQLLNMTLADAGFYRLKVSSVTKGGKLQSFISEPVEIVVKAKDSTASCNPIQPSLSISPQAQNAVAGSTLTYSIKIKNNDSTVCNSRNFALSVKNLPSNWTASFSNNSLSLAPGTLSDLNLNITSSASATAADYNIGVLVDGTQTNNLIQTVNEPSSSTMSGYNDLRNLSGSVGQTKTLTTSKISGTFVFKSTDPYGHGDDGGIVIAAPNGFWVRSFTHTLDDPIQLDWFELQNGDVVSGLMIQLAQYFSPRLFIKMPSTPMTLHHNSGLINWSATYGIKEFALLESDVETALKVDNLDAREVWKFKDVTTFIIGSRVKKANRDDYKFTFIGPWTWNNRGLTDADSIASGAGMIGIEQYQNITMEFHLRFDSKFSLSNTLYMYMNFGNKNIYISGVHRYGSGTSVGGQFSGIMHYEDAYFSDELGRGGGWLGTTDGAVSRTLAHARAPGTGGYATGYEWAEIYQITGQVTVQYGGSAFGMMYIDKFGTSLKDPLKVITKDFGWTGPNELGYPAGVKLQNPHYLTHPIKTDGLGEEKDDWRFLSITQQNQWGVSNWSRQVIFTENAKCDDIVNCSESLTTKTSYIYANAEGNHRVQNGTHVGDRMEGNKHYGDGIHPAFLKGSLSLIANDVAKYGQFYDISIVLVTDNGPPYFYPGSNNLIENVSITYKLNIADGAGANTARNVTFLGNAREVIRLGTGSTLTINNLCAPAGSTVAGTGTMILNGQTKVLPYFVQPADCSQRMADIPANPLLN